MIGTRKSLGISLAMILATQPALAAEPEMKEVNVSVFTGSLVTLIERVAVNNGFLEKEGLKGNFIEASTGPAMMSGVLGGSSQFTEAAFAVTWALKSQNECTVQFMSGQGGQYKLIARSDVDLPNAGKGFPASLQDLKGKRIGVPARGTPTELWVKMAMTDAGLDAENDATFVATGSLATVVPALENKLVDVQLSWPPLEWTLPKGSYKVVADLYNGDVPSLKGLVQTGAVTTCAFKEANPETFRRYCRALHSAYGFAMDPANNPTMAKAVAGILGVDDAIGLEIWQEYRTTFSGPELTKAKWDEQAKYIRKDGQPVVAPPYEEMVDDSCGRS